MKTIHTLIGLLLVLSTSALAGPGRIEIAAGDIPLVITNSGSFVVTEQLTGGVGDGIEIRASDVVIDFNGYGLHGAPGTVNGIEVDGVRSNVVVRNGSIMGCGGSGIQALMLNRGTFEDLQVIGNVSHGMVVGSRCRVKAVTAANNAGDGIRAIRASRIEGCMAHRNGNIVFGAGISVSNHCQVVDCVLSENGTYEIAVGESCMVTGNLIDGTGDNNAIKPATSAGILIRGSYNQVKDNHITGCVNGVHLLSGSRNMVVGNSAANNTSQNFRYQGGTNLRGETASTNIATTVNSYMNVSQ